MSGSIAILLFWSALTSHGQSAETVTTPFLPSRDLPAIQNQTGTGDALRGMCDGYEKLSRAYHAYRLANPTAPDLNTLTDSIRTKYGKEYLVKVLNAVTNRAFDGNVMLEGFKGAAQGYALTGEIALRMRATQQEQTLLLITRDKNGELFHRMSVYGATKLAAGGWELRVSDGNNVNDPKIAGQVNADRVTIRVKPGRHRLPNGSFDPDEWHVFVNGTASGEVYKGTGDMVRAPKTPDADLIKIIQAGQTGVPIIQIERDLVQPFRVGRTKQASAVILNRESKAGGVILQFDPGLVETRIDESKLLEMSERIAAFLQDEEPDGAVINIESRSVEMELIPLAGMRPGQSLGGFARVRGFVVRQDGEIFLAGQKGVSTPDTSLKVDDLVFALRAIYQDGGAPFISLDPDPKEFSRAQRVRVGGMNGAIKDSGFVRSMIEADYVMKKLSLGKLIPKDRGFKSWVSLMDSQPGRSVMRMWLEPAPAPLADAMIYQNPKGATAVFFESDVLALGESMLYRQDLLAQGGPRDRIVDQAASELTGAFDGLSNEYPEFRKLQGLFDLAKACQALRNLRIQSPELDRLCTLLPTRVEIPQTYPGIGPDVTPNGNVVSGGAVAKPQFRAGAAVWTEALNPMIAAAGVQRNIQIDLPKSVSIPKARLAGQTADLLIRQAKLLLHAGDAQNSLAILTRVAALQPSNEELTLLSASALFALDRTEEGVKALGDLPDRKPLALALRGLAYADAGNFQKAVEDAKALKIKATFDDRSMAMAALIHTLSCHFSEAHRDLAAARSLSPGSPILEFIGTKLRLFQGLGSDRAQRRLKAIRSLPYSIRQKALAATVDSKQGVALSREILADLDSGLFKVSAELAVRERAETVLTVRLLLSGEVQESKQLAEKLVREHPTWGSTRLVHGLVGYQTGSPIGEVIADLKSASAAKEDSAMEDLRAITGTVNPVISIGCTMAMDASRPSSDRTQVVKWVGKFLPSAEREFLNSIVSYGKVDTALILKTGGAQGLDRGDRLTPVKLAQLVPSGLSPDYATFLAGLSLFQIALSQSNLSTKDARQFRANALAMLALRTPDLITESEVSFRAATYLFCATSILQGHVNPTKSSVQDLGRISAIGTQLLERAPSSVKDREVVAYVKDLLSSTRKFWNTVAAGLKSELVPMSASSRDRLEVLLRWSLQSVFDQEPPMLKAIASRHPFIAGTTDWKALLSMSRTISNAQIGPLTESQLWTKIRAGLTTRQEAQDFEQAIQLLCKKRPALGPRIAEKWFQLRMLVTQLD